MNGGLQQYARIVESVNYQIELNIADEWEPGEFEEGDHGRKPVFYDDSEAADRALARHFDEMAFAGMDFDPADWRVANVESGL